MVLIKARMLSFPWWRKCELPRDVPFASLYVWKFEMSRNSGSTCPNGEEITSARTMAPTKRTQKQGKKHFPAMTAISSRNRPSKRVECTCKGTINRVTKTVTQKTTIAEAFPSRVQNSQPALGSCALPKTSSSASEKTVATRTLVSYELYNDDKNSIWNIKAQCMNDTTLAIF